MRHEAFERKEDYLVIYKLVHSHLKWGLKSLASEMQLYAQLCKQTSR